MSLIKQTKEGLEFSCQFIIDIDPNILKLIKCDRFFDDIDNLNYHVK